MVRQKCMDYILAAKDFFKNFIEEKLESVEQYVERKRQLQIWGDDVELQALSEIYGRPIEIYSYSNQPMRTFHEHCDSEIEPIRLSYHGKSHYNAVVPTGWTKDRIYVKEEPGVIEDHAIAHYNKDQDAQTKEEKEEKDEKET